MTPVSDVAGVAAAELGKRADPEAARQMAAYMKTDMSFHGARYAGTARPVPANDRRGGVVGLRGRDRRSPDRVPAAGALREIRPILEEWVDEDDLWLRRTAVLSQLRLKEDTEAAMLFDFCRRRADDRDFFIPKAIGWALRDYAKTDTDAVRDFVRKEAGRLSRLSRRESPPSISSHSWTVVASHHIRQEQAAGHAVDVGEAVSHSIQRRRPGDSGDGGGGDRPDHPHEDGAEQLTGAREHPSQQAADRAHYADDGQGRECWVVEHGYSLSAGTLRENHPSLQMFSQRIRRWSDIGYRTGSGAGT